MRIKIIEIFGLVVYNCKIEPNYFWDKMTWDEVEVVLDNYNKDIENTWIQTRFITYFCGNLDYKKVNQSKFIWNVEEEVELTIEDSNIVKQQMLELLNRL